MHLLRLSSLRSRTRVHDLHVVDLPALSVLPMSFAPAGPIWSSLEFFVSPAVARTILILPFSICSMSILISESCSSDFLVALKLNNFSHVLPQFVCSTDAFLLVSVPQVRSCPPNCVLAFLDNYTLPVLSPLQVVLATLMTSCAAHPFQPFSKLLTNVLIAHKPSIVMKDSFQPVLRHLSCSTSPPALPELSAPTASKMPTNACAHSWCFIVPVLWRMLRTAPSSHCLCCSCISKWKGWTSNSRAFSDPRNQCIKINHGR